MMVYKQISLKEAVQMLVEGKVTDLFFENAHGLVKASEVQVNLKDLSGYKWFERIKDGGTK